MGCPAGRAEALSITMPVPLCMLPAAEALVNLMLTGLLGFLALGWVVQAIQSGTGMRRIPHLENTEPLAPERCPSVSILVAARDEAERLPRALATLLAQDHPDFEVIVVDDRSTDGTSEILGRMQQQDERLQVLSIKDLPPGWLGKPHALQQAFQRSRGEWLVFTDADVRFAPEVLRRALTMVQRGRQDHLTLFGAVDMVGFWEKTAVSFFGMGLILYCQAWKVSDPRSRAYCGVGSFQMIRRTAYEAIGTHRRLAMEVIDDMKLGKLVKKGGFRSGMGAAQESIAVRWQEGFRNIIRGTTKNMFAGADFQLWRAVAQMTMLLAFYVLPFVLLPLTSGVPMILASVSAVLAVTQLGAWARGTRISPLFGLTAPLGALILCYMLARSTVVTLAQGGIRWRDTFYSLEDVRKGRV